MNKIKVLIAVLILAVLGGGIFFFVSESKKPGKYDDFARCISEKGAVFYGTFWCSHCQNQKALFGKSAKFLPYTECSTEDGKALLPICMEKGVSAFPTWRFADGSENVGEMSFEDLSNKTGCLLPE